MKQKEELLIKFEKYKDQIENNNSIQKEIDLVKAELDEFEEVLEEEIELAETDFIFAQIEIVDFQTYYLVNDYHSVLTSDYIPPETIV